MDKRSKRSKNTKNNTMVYLTEHDEAETNQEDFAMSFNTNILMFTQYPLVSDDVDYIMPIEHGLVLLDIARDMTDIYKQIAIVTIVATTAYMLNIDGLISAAFKLISNDNNIVDKFHKDIRFSRDDLDSYFESIDHVLEILEIDNSAEERAVDEISNMVLNTELN